MRMWNVDPKLMCNKHLLGEHVEMHMFVGTIQKGISMQGYLDGGLVETQHIRQRHDELVAEMERRGMNHKSPLPTYMCETAGHVGIEANLVEMARRCPACRALQEKSNARSIP